MNLKALLEQKAKKQEEMRALYATIKEEQRAFNEEEMKKFDALEAEIKNIDATINAIQNTRNLEPAEQTDDGGAESEKSDEDTEKREYQEFDSYLRSGEVRAESNMTFGANGAIVPTSIANKIIDKVVDMCPIYKDADRYNVKGTLSIPKYNAETGDIEMEYCDEFKDGESKSGKFANITLNGYLARAICDVSKSLINNSQFDIVSFVIRKMSQKIALFIEHELLHGTEGKIDGLKGVTQVVKTKATTAITADEIIDLQEAVPDVYQSNAYFIMNKATRTAIRKLKDGQGNYLLNKDANSRWGYTLFGKDVYTSDAMDVIATGKRVIYYGDYSGLAVKVAEDVNIDVLHETKARQHAVEVLGFVELDAKVQDEQKIATLQMA